MAKLDVADWFKEAQAGGVDFSKRDDPKVKQYIEQGAQYIRLQTELAAAQKNFTESRKGAAAAERAGAKDRKADAEATKRYNEQAAMAAATMAGPLAEATERQKQLEDKLKEALKEGRIERAAYNTLVLESQKALELSSAEVNKALSSPEALLATMDAEVAMLGKVGRARELSRRQMMNERDMRQELQKAVEAAGGKEALALAKGAESYEAYERSMLAAADASAALSIQVEEAAANAEAWANGRGSAAAAGRVGRHGSNHPGGATPSRRRPQRAAGARGRHHAGGRDRQSDVESLSRALSETVSFTRRHERVQTTLGPSGFVAGAGQNTARVDIYRQIGNNAESLWQVLNVAGSVNIMNEPDGADRAVSNWGGSFTVNDTSPSSETMQYRAVISGFTAQDVTHTSGTFQQQTITQSLAVISVEY
ncbi:hypothetical protein B0X78_02975 [bacterium AM6]|nr:hypothetical protein B0X78_02975 [bacterium AM6]